MAGAAAAAAAESDGLPVRFAALFNSFRGSVGLGSDFAAGAAAVELAAPAAAAGVFVPAAELEDGLTGLSAGLCAIAAAAKAARQTHAPILAAARLIERFLSKKWGNCLSESAYGKPLSILWLKFSSR
jgi:hypothetical protein